MNVLMFTNTYTPHVGGVARSVLGLVEGLRADGHRVVVVAPTFQKMPENEQDVIRVPALQHFRGSDFSVPMPVGRRLRATLSALAPDIIHSHHPFLLGDTALRVAAVRQVPLLFTYHTRYEHYGHYAPQDSPRMRNLALELALGYCQLCDAIIAPSESLAAFLREHGLNGLIEVIPTGVKLEQFTGHDGRLTRERLAIPEDAFVLGHVGRLAPEKNLTFLADVMTRFLITHPDVHCLIVGDGKLKVSIQRVFDELGLRSRVHMLGVLDAGVLADAYSAMDVFAFSSQSETQGLVLIEAMAAGVPVVALDAPGAREVVRTNVNGRLVAPEEPEAFLEALHWISTMSREELQKLRDAARLTARKFSLPASVQRVHALYQLLIAKHPAPKDLAQNAWTSARLNLHREWRLLSSIAHAVEGAVLQLDHEKAVSEKDCRSNER